MAMKSAATAGRASDGLMTSVQNGQKFFLSLFEVEDGEFP
jgi:hypothetical protein